MADNTKITETNETETAKTNETETAKTNETETAKTKAKAKKDEREEVFIPKGQVNDDPNLFVSVNGVNYLLPRGKSSKVPPEVAYEIKRSMRAEAAKDENIDKMLNQTE